MQQRFSHALPSSGICDVDGNLCYTRVDAARGNWTQRRPSQHSLASPRHYARVQMMPGAPGLPSGRFGFERCVFGGNALEVDLFDCRPVFGAHELNRVIKMGDRVHVGDDKTWALGSGLSALGCYSDSAGAKNTRTSSSSLISKKRCSTSAATKITLPALTACSSSPMRMRARPRTT